MTNDQPPEADALAMLTNFIDLMAEFGPDSTEATQFFEQHRAVPGFEELARSQYSLEKEDFEDRRSRFS